MVFPLKLTKFYGSSLPRPRIYVNPNGNERIDPPISVTDPLMSWAQEAHWSMGGLSFKRLRLMGKIEGNVGKLRTQRENEFKAQAHNKSPISGLRRSKISVSSPSKSPSPPPAPIASKRRRLVTLLEEEEEDQEVRVSAPVTRRRRLVKKLGDDFDRVASPENKKSDEVVVSDSTAITTTPKRSRRLIKIGDAGKKIVEEKEKKKVVVEEKEKSPNSGIRVRTSPRLSKIE
ncbi:hypothetical protein TSUD_104580 [Trifolium subterraneum]|uniref:Uncharacterized protein n=1 Tax=Trifolium subterraneum TaxID=3900 RepID=A0A2Z6N6G9_TRISU|nr:hypothetical protein TSUD_104580 [Trifolium subterraneum]